MEPNNDEKNGIEKSVFTVFLWFIISGMYAIYFGTLFHWCWNWHVAPIVDHRLSVVDGIGVYMTYKLVAISSNIKTEYTNGLWIAILTEHVFFLIAALAHLMKGVILWN